MCCLFASLVLLGPRFGALVWWLIDQTRWKLAFDNFLFAFILWLVAPWTMLMYVTVFPGGITGFDWIIMGIGVLADLASWSSGGISGRRRYQTTYQAY